MDNVIIYTSAICPYCVRAKQLLQAKGLTHNQIRLDLNAQKREEMIAKTGRQTVPQILSITSILVVVIIYMLTLTGLYEKYAESPWLDHGAHKVPK